MIAVLNEMVFYHSALGHSIRIIKVDSVGDSTPELSSPYQAVNEIQGPVPAAAAIPPQALPEAVPSPVHLLGENCAADAELVFFKLNPFMESYTWKYVKKAIGPVGFLFKWFIKTNLLIVQ